MRRTVDRAPKSTPRGGDLIIVPIDHADDPRLAGFRDVRERDLAGRDGLFIAEGRVVLEKAISADPGAIASVLIAAPKLPGMADLLAGLPAATPVYALGQAAMDQVVGFPIHRGLLALVRRPVRTPRAVLEGLTGRATVIVLVGISNHDNLGGIFRNAAAFGADAVLLDETCCDPLYRKAIRVSVGATLTVPFARAGDGAAILDLVEAAGFDTIALSPAGELRLSNLLTGPRVAMLLGGEGPGLPTKLLARSRTVRIDMSRGFDSLNVATTSGIVLHHLTSRQALAAESST